MCPECDKLRTLLAERDAQIRGLEARILVVRAEMHEARNEANIAQQRLNLLQAQAERSKEPS